MSALRIFVWLFAFVTALDTLTQVQEFRKALEDVITLRRIILSKEDKLCQKFCEAPPPAVQAYWREDDLWTLVCPSFTGFSELPRYWKLTMDYKYKLLFIREIPITLVIVIST